MAYRMMFGKLKLAVGSHTRHEWEKLCQDSGFLCFWCGRPTCEKSLDPQLEITKGHLCPVSRGGVEFIWNIVVACFHCNRLQGSKMPGEFLQSRTSFARPLDGNAKNFTRIPFSKERDGRGNLVAAHLEVSSYANQAIRYLDDRRGMDPTDEWYEQRRQLLRNQAQMMIRLQAESAGQMVLPIFGDGTARKLAQTENAALTFKGMDLEKKA